MDKEFIPYEEALALKELGFDESCIAFGYIYGEEQQSRFLISTSTNKNSDWSTDLSKTFISIPTYSQAFRWFREKYDMVGDVTVFDKGFLEKGKWCYQFRIHLPDDPDNFLIDTHEFKTYEEAELACLRKLIEIVKSKQ